MKNTSNLQKTRYLKYRKAVPDLLLQQWEAYLFHKISQKEPSSFWPHSCKTTEKEVMQKKKKKSTEQAPHLQVEEF